MDTQCCGYLLTGRERSKRVAGQSLLETTASTLSLVSSFIFSNQDVNFFGL